MARAVRKASVRRTAAPSIGASRWAAFSWQAAAITGLVLIAYWNSLEGSFHFDDWSLLNDADVVGTGFGWRLFRLGLTRPLTYWSFHLNFLAGSSAESTIGFHLVNVSLHAMNSLLVLWIARKHLDERAAFLAAALFAVHPLETEAVSYIFARASLLSTVFVLLCFALFLRARYAWSAAAFAISLLAKEEAAALPAFLLLYDYLRVARRDWREIARRKWYYAALLGFVVLAAARLFYVLKITPEPGVGLEVRGIPPLVYALTEARVVWRYLALVVLPIHQNLDYDIAFSRSLWQPATTLPALIALLALLAWLIREAGRGEREGGGLKPEARSLRPAFWALGFFLLLAPSSSVVAQADAMYEHRTYLPMASLVMALGWLLWRATAWLRSSGARAGAATALVLALTAATVARNQVWANELSLWRDVVRRSPNKGRPYIGLARGLTQSGQPEAARQALERGVAVDPNNRDLRLNAGVLALQEGDGPAALAHFERALRLGREIPEVWNNLGAAHSLLGHSDQAIEAWHKALALDPCFYNTRRNLALELPKRGQAGAAIEAATLPAGCRLPPHEQQALEQLRSQISGNSPPIPQGGTDEHR
jgi:tetratricopeptide (TPR) repeat protein